MQITRESWCRSIEVGVLNKETRPKDLTRTLTILSNAMARIINSEFAVHSVTYKEYTLISALLEEGECSARDLAPATATTSSSLSRIINSLVERGLVTRRRPRCDRRVVMVRLTEAGLALGHELQQAVRVHEDRLTEGICVREVEELLTLMEKIIANGAKVGLVDDQSLQSDSPSLEVN